MERKPLSFSISITVTGATSAEPGGNGSNTTPSNSAIANAGGYLKQLIVIAPAASAQFNFRIENPNGRTVLRRTEQYGEIINEVNTPMPAGTYTCYIERSSNNGTFNVELIFAEVY